MTTTLSPDSQICSIALIGDNHFGYMGYRSSVSPQVVYNKGTIGFVVNDWRNENNQVTDYLFAFYYSLKRAKRMQMQIH